MPLIAKSGVVSGNSVSFSIARYAGIFLYIDYSPGDETDCILEFSVIDTKNPDKNNFYYLVQDTNDGIKKYTLALTKTLSRYVIPLPVPESADILKIDFNFIGASTEGTVGLFINTDSFTQ